MAENDIYTTALKNTLNEMRKSCPEIQHAFVFRKTGEIVAEDGETPEKVMIRVVDAFDDILERAEAIGGVEAITLNGSGGTVTLHCFGEHNLVTVTSANADLKYVNTLTRVLIPTVLKLLEKISPTPLTNMPSTKTPPPAPAPELEPETQEVKETREEPIEEPPIEKRQEEAKPEMLPLEPPATQLMVENIGGLLVPSDTVRIDAETLKQWENTFEGKKIEYVSIETFDGKTTKCKVKPIKDLKYYGKGVVQIPEKMQINLEIKKGELVRVKPIIE